MTTSLRRVLLAWLLGGSFAATILAGLIAYIYSLHTADEMFDRQLVHIASNLPLEIRPQPEPPDNGDPSDDVYIQIRDLKGRRIYPTRPSVPIPFYGATGYREFEFNDTTWRVYTQEQPERLVQVAQSEDLRRTLAAGLAVRTVLAFMVLLPLLAIVIWRVVDRTAASMAGLAGEVGRRSARALDPLPLDRIPGEMRPMVVALNDLLQRLDSAMTLQRNFIADAAHELRSPVTALKLQLQLQERARGGAAPDPALQKIRERVERIAHLVEQLLQLARAEPAGLQRPVDAVELGGLLHSIVGEFATQAESESVNLTWRAGDAPVVVPAQADSLRILFGNLIDNALRYCGSGGQVTARVGRVDGLACVEVEDDGPGIPPEEHERVFDRFHRLEGSGRIGSGLGLAIVRAIAQRHGARVSLHAGAAGKGLRVRVLFQPDELAAAPAVPAPLAGAAGRVDKMGTADTPGTSPAVAPKAPRRASSTV